MNRWAIAGALLLLSACGREAKTKPSEAVFVSGRIEGDQTDIALKTSGRILEITVREGDAVKAGQVVARVDGPQERARRDEAEARLRGSERRLEQLKLQLPVFDERIAQSKLLERQAGADAPGRVSQAEAQMAAAMSEKVRAEADLKQNRADAERYAVLAEKGAVSRQIAEQALTRVRASEAAVESVAKQIAAAEAGVRVARAALANPEIRRAEGETLQRQVSELRAQIRLAESDVSAARAALARADADITDLEIKAPVDGVVITRSAEPGRVAAAGATILSLVDLRRLYLRGFVPEGNIGFVKVGQPAEVFLDSDQKTPIAAEVLRIDPQAMFTPENTYFKEDRVKQVVGVKILLKGGVGAAKPGMPADGRIRTSEPGKA